MRFEKDCSGDPRRRGAVVKRGRRTVLLAQPTPLNPRPSFFPALFAHYPPLSRCYSFPGVVLEKRKTLEASARERGRWGCQDCGIRRNANGFSSDKPRPTAAATRLQSRVFSFSFLCLSAIFFFFFSLKSVASSPNTKPLAV